MAATASHFESYGISGTLSKEVEEVKKFIDLKNKKQGIEAMKMEKRSKKWGKPLIGH